jgi:hypothetical protein
MWIPWSGRHSQINSLALGRTDATSFPQRRNDRSAGRQLYERFTYDAQQRLLMQSRGTNSTNASTPVLNMGYNALGNITSRNGVGYVYGGNSFGCAVNSGPHAASSVGAVNYCFDSRGNQLKSSDGRELTYFAFDLPETIKKQQRGCDGDGGFRVWPES